ncbi:IclR family transcriptional regulator [Dermatophilaceae bacterium Sec6.4]
MVAKSVQSVERAASMLRLLASETEPLRLMQVCTALDLAKGTTHGLLHTLVEVGFVTQDTSGRYLLSPDLPHLGSTHLDLNELRSLGLNWTDTLAARTGESARLAAFHDGQVVVAHHVFRARTSRSRQEVQTGFMLPLHASALGKVLLAFDPGAARSIIGTDLTSLTFRTVVNRSQLMRELADVRDDGWGACVEEAEPDLADIAAPVRDSSGHVVAAIGIHGAVGNLCDEQLRPWPQLTHEVTTAARQISRVLGHGAL